MRTIPIRQHAVETKPVVFSAGKSYKEYLKDASHTDPYNYESFTKPRNWQYLGIKNEDEVEDKEARRQINRKKFLGTYTQPGD